MELIQKNVKTHHSNYYFVPTLKQHDIVTEETLQSATRGNEMLKVLINTKNPKLIRNRKILFDDFFSLHINLESMLVQMVKNSTVLP